VTLSDLAKYSITRRSRGLSATAELLVQHPYARSQVENVLLICSRQRGTAGCRRSGLLTGNITRFLSCVSRYNVVPIGLLIQSVVNQCYVISIASLVARVAAGDVGGPINFPRVAAPRSTTALA